MRGVRYLKAHCVTCAFAGPLLSAFDQCRTDAFAAVFAVDDEHAELSDSIAHELDVHRPNEHAVDLGQDQRLSANRAEPEHRPQLAEEGCVGFGDQGRGWNRPG